MKQVLTTTYIHPFSYILVLMSYLTAQADSCIFVLFFQGQTDKTVFDMELHMKQRCGTEFLQAEKNTPDDIL